MTTRSVSIEEAATKAGVSRRTIYNRIADGTLLTIRVGQSQRVTPETLDYFIAICKSRAPVVGTPLRVVSP